MDAYMKKGIFYISLAVIVGILTFSTHMPDYDLWARLAVGSIFFATGHVLKHDIFSFLPTKVLWVDHEWGSGVVFYFFVKYFGDSGLFILKALILFAIFFLIIKTIRLQNGKNTAGIFYFIFLGFSLLPGIANLLRSQMFTYLFFTLWIYILEKMRREEIRLPWILPLTMLCWVNMHGGFLAGIGLVIIYAFGALLNREKYLKYFGLLALIIPVTLINPYGFHLWNFIIDAALMPRPYVTEWMPVSFNGPFHVMKGLKIHVHAGFMIFSLLTVIAGIKLYVQKGKPDWTRILLFILLFYVGIRHQRHATFLVLAVPAIFYYHYVNLFDPLQNFIPNNPSDQMRKTWMNLKQCFGYVVLAMIIIFMLPQLSNKARLDPLRYPVGSFEFIRQNNISGNLATTFGWGSYAFWKLYPQCRVLIDGRYEEVYSNDIYLPAMQCLENKGSCHDLLTKYNTDILVLSKNTFSPDDVLSFSNWGIVYQDVSSVVLLPKNRIKSVYIYPDGQNPAYLKEDLSRIIPLNS